MNGLDFIRKRCNLSLTELAGLLGVTRQAVSSWVNGKRAISEERLLQLEDVIGVDRRFFGEITEEDRQYIIGRAMFRYDMDGHETYRFKPDPEQEQVTAVFFCDMNASLDEILGEARRYRDVTLEGVESRTGGCSAECILEQASMTKLGCDAYNFVTKGMDYQSTRSVDERVCMRMDMLCLVEAFHRAYGIEATEDSQMLLEDIGFYTEEDREFLLDLESRIRSHWEFKIEQRRQRIAASEDLREKLQIACVKLEGTLQEQIEEIERIYNANQFKPEMMCYKLS